MGLMPLFILPFFDTAAACCNLLWENSLNFSSLSASWHSSFYRKKYSTLQGKFSIAGISGDPTVWCWLLVHKCICLPMFLLDRAFTHRPPLNGANVAETDRNKRLVRLVLLIMISPCCVKLVSFSFYYLFSVRNRASWPLVSGH